MKVLFLRLDQALDLERAAKNLKERLVVRYMAFNGLSASELAEARIENLDPIECTLFLPRRHWKRTFAKEWLLAGGSIGSLQKQLSHKHLWSTAHYLQFVLEDVRKNHARLMERVKLGQTHESPRLVL